MGNRFTTFSKRDRETRLRERAKAKDERRVQKRTETPVASGDGEDPDIAGIVPGPQPIIDGD